ncbi:peptidase A4 family-domain-containing protein [Xylariaceae sp. FL0016]|nr:peptidase A4 family-domain-containing protein [Xylariaceae sp. FL0016]
MLYTLHITLLLLSGVIGGARRPTKEARQYQISFLSGPSMYVDQDTPGEPAIAALTAEWDVAFVKPFPGIDYSNDTNRHSLSQWVGILGGACPGAEMTPCLQAGTHSRISADGTETESFIWVEWFPDAGLGFTPAPVVAIPGDHFRVTVEVYTAATGKATIENLSRNQSYATLVSAQHPELVGEQICPDRGSADIYVEWFITNDRGIPGNPFAFNNVSFTNISALSRSSKSYDLGTPGAATYVNMVNEYGTVVVAEPVDNTSAKVYSPLGLDWTPSSGAYGGGW